MYRPLGSTANKMGRIVGDTLTSESLQHRGILGTGIVRVFDMVVAYTGLTEQDARDEGFEIKVLYKIKPDKADYLGGKELTIKAIADAKDPQKQAVYHQVVLMLGEGLSPSSKS